MALSIVLAWSHGFYNRGAIAFERPALSHYRLGTSQGTKMPKWREL